MLRGLIALLFFTISFFSCQAEVYYPPYAVTADSLLWQVSEKAVSLPAEALRDLEMAGKICGKNKYHPGYGSILLLNTAAEKAIKNGDPKTARALLNFSLKYSAGARDYSMLGNEYSLKALCQRYEDEADSAIYNLRVALAYYHAGQDTVQEKLVSRNIEMIFYTLGNVAAAQSVLLMRGESLEHLETFSVLFFGLYLGALLFCFIYNLYLYRFTGDKSYRELAKCIFCFSVYIYTVNNNFAAQWSTNQWHYTTIEFFKNNASFLSNYFFATFIFYLLEERRQSLSRFYKFLSFYKKLMLWLIIGSNLIVFFSLYRSVHHPEMYLSVERIWFSFNSIIGLLLTIIFFVALFVSAAKNKVRINYLIYGFIINVLFLSLSFTQTTVGNKFSGIPHPHALGAVFFLVFMTVAIADKINMYRKEKENAQQEAMAQLEKLVSERTYDLEIQKQILQERNKRITDSINYARRIQISLLPTIKYLQKNFDKLRKK